MFSKIENEYKLADEHWFFISGLLSFTDFKRDSDFIEYQKYLYKQAFIHGYKHAKETYKKDKYLNETSM